MLYLGVDLGGTNIKAALVNSEGEILCEANTPTNLPRPAEAVCDDIAALCLQLAEGKDVAGVGVGCPGTVDGGTVLYSNNLDWHDFAMEEYLAQKTGLPVAVGNDANVAALGEALAGCAKGAQSTVVVTLGTGVGAGVVLDGKLLTGYTGAASEAGHMVILDTADAPRCTCGRHGCLEALASATALIRMTKEARLAHPESALNVLAAKPEDVNGRTAFDAAAQGDAAAQQVVDTYMEYAKKCNADLLLATDPDCDRVGIAVKNKAGKYELLTGNQTGMLLLDYICCQRVKHGKMPADPVMVKTIVTMDMGEQIATHYGLRTINVLTGFKFIGEQIGKLEKQGRADSYVFGFEESYGYLTGSYVRDKDGVDGAYMICEMFSYYATKGISLLDKLDELYKTYGYCLNTLHSYEFDGSAGFAKMQSIMQAFRGNIKAFGGKKVVKLLDYAYGLDGLPKSEVLKFLLEDNCSIVVRPSGTEPKLKIYISVSAENREAAEKVECEIVKDAEKWFA